jgi:hypothetical protein
MNEDPSNNLDLPDPIDLLLGQTPGVPGVASRIAQEASGTINPAETPTELSGAVTEPSDNSPEVVGAERPHENSAKKVNVPGTPGFRQCTARSSQQGRRCARRAMVGREVCYSHGGRTPRGIASPFYKGKGYSQELPKQLLKKYKDALEDHDLLSMRNEVALLHVRIAELVERLETGETGKLWDRLKTSHTKLHKAMLEGDTDGFMAEVTNLGTIITSGVDYEKAWRALGSAIEKKSDIATREWKRLNETNQVITSERAMLLIIGIMEAIRAVVTDRRQLIAIQEKVSLLMRSGEVPQQLEPTLEEQVE